MIIMIISLSGCSSLIEKSAQYSEFKFEEYTQDQIHQALGTPVSSEVVENEFGLIRTTEKYEVKGRVFDCGNYWASQAGWVMTFGLHELIFFPIAMWEVIRQGVSPTTKELVITYLNNDYYCQSVKPLPAK